MRIVDINKRKLSAFDEFTVEMLSSNNNGEADKDETKYTIKYLNKDGSVFKEFNNKLVHFFLK